MKVCTLLTVVGLAVAELQAADVAKAATQEKPAEQLNWFSNWDKAKAAAKEQNKPIFLYFTGSDWCPWCKKMDGQILSTADFQGALSDKMIFMKVDFPKNTKLDPETQKQNNILKESYGVSGFPTVIVLDANLKQLGKLGFDKDGPKAFVSKVDALINAAK